MFINICKRIERHLYSFCPWSRRLLLFSPVSKWFFAFNSIHLNYPLYLRTFKGYWDMKQLIKYFQRIIDVDKEPGIFGRVYHETHRSCSLCTPWIARDILNAVPQCEHDMIIWWTNRGANLPISAAGWDSPLTYPIGGYWRKIVGLYRWRPCHQWGYHIACGYTWNNISAASSSFFMCIIFTRGLEPHNLPNVQSRWTRVLHKRDVLLKAYGSVSSKAITIGMVQTQGLHFYQNTGEWRCVRTSETCTY